MVTRGRGVVVDEGRCVFCSIPTKKIHHLDFPEIWAESGSIADALSHLSGQLSLYREGAQSPWHRELIDVALSDLAEFGRSLEDVRPPEPPPCRCVPGQLSALPMETRVPIAFFEGEPESRG